MDISTYSLSLIGKHGYTKASLEIGKAKCIATSLLTMDEDRRTVRHVVTVCCRTVRWIEFCRVTADVYRPRRRSILLSAMISQVHPVGVNWKMFWA